MSERKRWPVTQTDELVRHVARQLPELTRRQVLAVLNTTMVAVRESLMAQARQGVPDPVVKVRSAGSFELRWYKSVRRHHLDGTLRTVPPRWKLFFRPSRAWLAATAEASQATRTTLQGPPEENPSKEMPLCDAWSRGDEAGARDVPDLRPAGDPSDRGGERPDGAGTAVQAEGGSQEWQT